MRELVIEGGVHVALNLPSLSPLGKLTGLRRLELPNVMSSDSSLEPLAKLRSLEHLFLSARAFEVEGIPLVAVALPGAEGRCLEPSWVPGKSPGSYTFPCPRCGQAQAFLNGKGMRRSCPECKAPYIKTPGSMGSRYEIILVRCLPGRIIPRSFPGHRGGPRLRLDPTLLWLDLSSGALPPASGMRHQRLGMACIGQYPRRQRHSLILSYMCISHSSLCSYVSPPREPGDSGSCRDRYDGRSICYSRVGSA